MKRFLIPVVFALFFVSGCQRTVPYPTLSDSNPSVADVYRLKDAYPDSAYAIFNRIADTIDEPSLKQMSAFLFFEYQVLKKELSYKNFKFSSNDSLVAAAYGFYDSLVEVSRAFRDDEFLKFQLARAAYYKAVSEEWREPTQVQAFSEYVRALWITDGLARKRQVFPPKKSKPEYEHFAGLTYDRLAWLLYNHDVFEFAMECLERSNECFEREGDMEGIASNYDLMGDVMLAQEDRDAAVRYYGISDSIYALLNNENGFYEFVRFIHRVIEVSNSGDKARAKSMLQSKLGETDHRWIQRRSHFGLAYVYYDLQQYDSALYHYEQSIPLLPRQNLKSYSRIVQLSNMLGDSLKAARYGELLADYSLNLVTQNSQKTRLMALYEEFKDDSKDAHTRDVFYFIALLVLVLAIIILVDSFLIERRRRKHKNDMELHARIKSDLEDEINSVKEESTRKDDKIKALEDELQMVVSSPDFLKLPFEEKMAVLFEMPICKRVLKVADANVKAGVAYPELVLSDNQMNMLVNAVDAVFPKFSVKLIEMFPRLKRSDVVYCCMYVLGVTEIQAAALTGKTYQAVWKRSLKLHAIFDNKADMQFILHDLLRNWQ